MNGQSGLVVPFVGTWIEIQEAIDDADYDVVVPFVGTWIEIVGLRST